MVEAKAVIKESKEDKSGNSPIFVQYIYKQKSALFYTGLKVSKSFWDKKTQKLNSIKWLNRNKSNQELIEQLKKEDLKKNNQVAVLKSKINQIIIDLEFNNIAPTLDEVKHKFHQSQNGSALKAKLFLDVIDEYIEFKRNIRPKLSTFTIKHFITLKNHLTAFKNEKNFKLTFKSIDQSFYNKYLKYLYDDLGHVSNTVGTQIKELKTFLNWATEFGFNKNFDYKKFKKPKSKTNFTYLTKEEIEHVYNFDFSFNKRLEVVRDLFILSCATGLRYSDYSRLSTMNKKDDKIDTDFKKTGDRLPVYLNKYSKSILEKYDWTMPKKTNQEINRVVKILGRKAGLTEPELIIKKYGDRVERSSKMKWELLSTHVGRHTFIRSLEGGIRPEVVIRQTGHKDIRTLMNYVKITDTIVKEDFDRVWN